MICGAKTRNGGICQTHPMENGRCRLHGGLSTGRPLITGRYSLVHRQSLAEKYQRFLDDPRPGDLTEELALMRGLLQDYLERLDSDNLEGADIERLFSMMAEIAKLVERISRIINSTALTAAEVKFLQVRIADLLQIYVPDDDQRIQFMAELSQSISDKPAFG